MEVNQKLAEYPFCLHLLESPLPGHCTLNTQYCEWPKSIFQVQYLKQHMSVSELLTLDEYLVYCNITRFRILKYYKVLSFSKR